MGGPSLISSTNLKEKSPLSIHKMDQHNRPLVNRGLFRATRAVVDQGLCPEREVPKLPGPIPPKDRDRFPAVRNVLNQNMLHQRGKPLKPGLRIRLSPWLG